MKLYIKIIVGDNFKYSKTNFNHVGRVIYVRLPFGYNRNPVSTSVFNYILMVFGLSLTFTIQADTYAHRYVCTKLPLCHAV